MIKLINDGCLMLIDDSFGDDNISQDQSGIILISGKPRYQLGEFAY